MMEVPHAFQAGGLFVWMAVATSIPAWLLAGVTALVMMARRVPSALIILGFLTFIPAATAIAMGVIGYYYGMHHVDAALTMASPEFHEEMRRVGQSEAMYPVYFGLGGGVPPMLVAIVSLVLGATGLRNRQGPDDPVGE